MIKNNRNQFKPFEYFKENISKKQPHITLLYFVEENISGSLYKLQAMFNDSVFGNFKGRYDQVCKGYKKHELRIKQNIKLSHQLKSPQRIENAKKRISDAFSHLELLEYNGQKEESLFLDKEYGRFKGMYLAVLAGHKSHKDRVKAKREKDSLKRYLSFDDANKRINDLYPHLTLLKYNGYNEECLFLDSEYGEFPGVYKRVLRGQKNHEERGKIYKVERAKETWLELHGVENISQLPEVKQLKVDKALEVFNCINVFQAPEIQAKSKDTCQAQWGVDYATQAPEIKDKISETNVKSGRVHSINGVSLRKYYFASEINGIVNYGWFKHCYLTFGEKALEPTFYKILKGRSRLANMWLDQIEQQLGRKLVREYYIKGKGRKYKYFADGYDPITNTIYEFYGDYWHGNPATHKYGFNVYCDNSFNTLYYKTMDREEKLIELEYNVISIWENDFNIN